MKRCIEEAFCKFLDIESGKTQGIVKRQFIQLKNVYEN